MKMYSFQQIPKELLYNIVDGFSKEDLLKCQQVCRHWYMTIHIVILKEIHLHSTFSTLAFINSIDQNPHPLFLHSVKSISISISNDFTLNRAIVEKVFLRFPKLKAIHLSGSRILLDALNNDICKSILKKCPNLEKFQVDSFHLQPLQYQNLVVRLQGLLTVLDLEQAGGRLRFIKRLHGIKQVNCISLKQAIAVLDQLPNLNSIDVLQQLYEDDGFVKYYNNKKNKKKTAILSRLSKITYLKLNCKSIPVETIEFVSKHFTGLQTFILTGSMKDGSRNAADTFSTSISSLLRSAKVHIELKEITNDNSSSLKGYLTPFLKTLLDQTPTSRSTLLQIGKNTTSKDDGSSSRDGEPSMLSIQKDQYSKKTSIWAAQNDGLFSFESSLQRVGESLQNVKTFHVIQSFDPNVQYQFYVEQFEKFLSAMPSLKEVNVHIPSVVVRTQSMYITSPDESYQGAVNPLVETITVRTTARERFQVVFDRFFYTFPNVKRFNLHYSTGLWCKDDCEFQVLLGNYKLRTLRVDLTPVKLKAIERSMKKDFFFVININLPDKQYLYRADSGVSISKIEHEDLEEFTAGKDYLKVYIKIARLIRIELCIADHELNNYFDVPDPRITMESILLE